MAIALMFMFMECYYLISVGLKCSFFLVLLSSADPERVELSLIAAEGLVRKNSFAAKEVSQHFIQKAALKDFSVGIVAHNPFNIFRSVSR